ncbi:MAG: hypothetical protein ACYTEU_09105 [Planctomycetota bacterium]
MEVTISSAAPSTSAPPPPSTSQAATPAQPQKRHKSGDAVMVSSSEKPLILKIRSPSSSSAEGRSSASLASPPANKRMTFGGSSEDLPSRSVSRSVNEEEIRRIADGVAASVAKRLEHSMFTSGQEAISKVITTLANIDSHDILHCQGNEELAAGVATRGIAQRTSCCFCRVKRLQLLTSMKESTVLSPEEIARMNRDENSLARNEFANIATDFRRGLKTTRRKIAEAYTYQLEQLRQKYKALLAESFGTTASLEINNEARMMVQPAILELERMAAERAAEQEAAAPKQPSATAPVDLNEVVDLTEEWGDMEEEVTLTSTQKPANKSPTLADLVGAEINLLEGQAPPPPTDPPRRQTAFVAPAPVPVPVPTYKPATAVAVSSPADMAEIIRATILQLSQDADETRRKNEEERLEAERLTKERLQAEAETAIKKVSELAATGVSSPALANLVSLLNRNQPQPQSSNYPKPYKPQDPQQQSIRDKEQAQQNFRAKFGRGRGGGGGGRGRRGDSRDRSY